MKTRSLTFCTTTSLRTIILSFTLFLLTFDFFLLNCSKKPTEPDNTVTFSGKVTLEGQTDHSDVTIALYKPVELDTALVRINKQYPQHWGADFPGN